MLAFSIDFMRIFVYILQILYFLASDLISVYLGMAINGYSFHLVH